MIVYALKTPDGKYARAGSKSKFTENILQARLFHRRTDAHNSKALNLWYQNENVEIIRLDVHIYTYEEINFEQQP